MKTGDKIKVRVIGVDRARNRIALSARTKPRGESRAAAAAGQSPATPNSGRSATFNRPSSPRSGAPRRSGFVCNPFANL